MNTRRLFPIVCLYFFMMMFGFAHTAFAHEVYVLDSSEIHFALGEPVPDFLDTVRGNLQEFAFWGVLVFIVIIAVYMISTSRRLERLIDPHLSRLKTWAPRLAQATLGLALIASGYYGAVFGVELPLSAAFGSLGHLMGVILMITGAMLLFGILPRIAGIMTTALFVGLAFEYHGYMLNYATYLGEALTLSVFGGAYALYSSGGVTFAAHRIIPRRFYPYKFLIMRVLFGSALIYASVYAKFVHGALALATVSKYDLTRYFPFDPVFLVLGAMLVEVLIGLCFIFGFEVRFASIFFLVFLCLSIGFFGEAVWPHIILIGTALSTFLHGYDKFSLSWTLEGRRKMEPVL